MEIPLPDRSNKAVLQILNAELKAEDAHQCGNPQGAAEIIQTMLDSTQMHDTERQWFLQERARYTFAFDQNESNTLQKSAHFRNRFLLKPRHGMIVKRLQVNQQRAENILKWVKLSQTSEQLRIDVEQTLSNIEFGVEAERFESAIDRLGKALGFASERPDKHWKAGPDNLWALDAATYLLVECKSQVMGARTEISKAETGQMNNACAWFGENYNGASAVNLLIIPFNRLGRGAGFNEEVGIVTKLELNKLCANARNFFKEFDGKDFAQIAASEIHGWIDQHHLTIEDLKKNYSRKATPQ
jgi:hypothetical protein